jgi:hypothetical protein
VLESRGKRMEEMAVRVGEADAETLWAMIRELAQEHDYPLAMQILRVGEHEHWSLLHISMALAYAHMVLADAHGDDIKDMFALMNRPIIMNRHCDNCLCEDKSLKVG